MLEPTHGKVFFEQQDIYALSGKERARIRADKIGFIFQLFHLLPYLNCLENIQLPLKVSDKSGHNNTTDLIKRLGLKERARHKPRELSIGERQRTAVARAMLKKPTIILADEPTGNLDPENARQVFGYLSEFHKNNGTVVVVSHGEIANGYADRILELKDGQLNAGS
jgi:putative ABC transport system ATP-binding protein